MSVCHVFKFKLYLGVSCISIHVHTMPFCLQQREKEGRPVEYMARKYGHVVTPENQQTTHFELKFRTSKKLKSMIVLNMVADGLKTVTNL